MMAPRQPEPKDMIYGIDQGQILPQINLGQNILGSICWATVASDPPSEVASDAGIRGKYVGSAGGEA